MEANEEQTKTYYNSFGDVYELIWDEQIHTGYFDQKKSLDQAIKDMNYFLADLAILKKDSKILTIGSGRGGTDRFLVKYKNASIVGIDISERQQQEARNRAETEGLENKIKYLLTPMTNISLKDKNFDYIWVQESFFHCHNKLAAIQEFVRLLKPGGKVVLEDTVLLKSKAKDEVLKVFGSRVFINEINTPKQYTAMFQRHGLNIESEVDFSNHLAKTYTAIINYIRKNKGSIRAKIPEKYYSTLESDFGFPASLKLVKEGKLGCVAMVFTKTG